MMNILEEAIIYSTVLHQGKVRKFGSKPYILHPMEVAQILSSMTDDLEVITAGILHDIVEDTDGTLIEIEKRFGKRVAALVDSESENKYPGEDPAKTWRQRKEESLLVMKNSEDIGVKMLWLADKLANIRSLAALYSEKGEELWKGLHGDPDQQLWYYRTIAETVELTLNRTGAFKEFIKHINFVWPGTFDSDKARYKKYKEVSIDGCELLAHGSTGDLYRYDDELVIKVFNQKKTYNDVEMEIALSRMAFVLGIPTAISFGLVSVGKQYGAMYELLDSDTISRIIAKAPGQVDQYAGVMANLAREIHSIEVMDEYELSDASERLMGYIDSGVGCEDKMLAERCRKLLKTIPSVNTLVHGEFHTGNVFLQKGEPLLINVDRISKGHPIVEISDVYYFYVILGEDDPSAVQNFMGFSYETAKQFYVSFLKHYLGTEDDNRIREVTEKASLLGYMRMISRIRLLGSAPESDRKEICRYLEKIADLTDRLDTLIW